MKAPFDIIWEMIETIAERRNLSVSALAKSAGLDVTTFNKSKRCDKKTQLYRYPSMTTVLAVMKVTGMTWHDWAELWDEIENKGEKK